MKRSLNLVHTSCTHTFCSLERAKDLEYADLRTNLNKSLLHLERQARIHLSAKFGKTKDKIASFPKYRSEGKKPH